jgi:hypothetical protein
MFKCETELREKVEALIPLLLQQGIAVESSATRFYDYMVKIELKSSGFIKLYYKPKTSAFSINTDEVREKTLVALVHTCWENLNGTTQTDTRETDLMAVLEKEARAFNAYLIEQGIEAEYKAIYNGQFARLIIKNGYFDLYNTVKQPLTPRTHQLEEAIRGQIDQLWRQYHAQSSLPVSRDQALLEEVEHYLNIFAPYRHYDFDFSSLAQALHKVVGYQINLNPYDFNELERLYQHLRVSL